MADLMALQPNMDIKLPIVGPDAVALEVIRSEVVSTPGVGI